MSHPAVNSPVIHSHGGQAHTRAAIAQAADATGVDFDYLLAQAQIESGMNPDARARTSSAGGLYQFIDQTWLSTLDRHGERLGLGQFAQAIDSSSGRARITDPAMRDAIMGLRFDPQAAALMAGALATDNAAALQPVLGREPDASELYLAHFLGADGATRFLQTLGSNPDANAAAILPRAAGSNRGIFYDGSGAPRSVAGVMELVRGRVEGAMEQGFDLPAAGLYPGGTLTSPGASQPARRASLIPTLGPPPAPAPARGAQSMARTIEDSFGLGAEGSNQPGLDHIRRAYARLGAFGL